MRQVSGHGRRIVRECQVLAASKCSLRGSSPRPMAHKTIALTTELKEPDGLGQIYHLQVNELSGRACAAAAMGHSYSQGAAQCARPRVPLRS